MQEQKKPFHERFNYETVRHYKDGETRDKRGRWAGKVVTLRKEYYQLIDGWRQRSGMPKAKFWREAVMRGALELAKEYGIDAIYPPLEDAQVKPREETPKKKGKFWLFYKIARSWR